MNDAHLMEIIGTKERIYKGKILDVQKWTVTLPNGESSLREIMIHNGASAIAPVDDEGNVYLVRQFRTPFERVLLEVPAGKLDYAGEDRLEAAKRELREETGFTAEHWTHLTDLLTTPGFCSEVISLYLARGLEKGSLDLDDDEFIDLVKMPLDEALQMVYDGKIADAKTVSCLLLAKKHLK